MERYLQMALEAGFSHAGPLDPGLLEANEQVRAMCSADKCHAYGKNWTCPPACGTLEECAQRMHSYTRGILVQSVGTLEDEFDFEGMMDLEASHKQRFAALAAQLQDLEPEVLPLGSGGCRLCESCAWPKPCRFPGKAHSSMEAYGLVVSQVCQQCGMPYYYGKGTLAYTSCFLLK